MADLSMSIRGLQAAQRAMEKAYHATRAEGGLGRAVKAITAGAHRAAVANTPWWSGGLRAAHRMRFSGRGNRAQGIVDIDPGLRNPAYPGSPRPHVYGYMLHKQGMRPGRRGGIRAFYEYTVKAHGRALLQAGADELRRSLP